MVITYQSIIIDHCIKESEEFFCETKSFTEFTKKKPFTITEYYNAVNEIDCKGLFEETGPTKR